VGPAQQRLAGVLRAPAREERGSHGDERTYDNTVAVRSVNSVDGMTADWSRLPWDFLARISNRIINEVRGVKPRGVRYLF